MKKLVFIIIVLFFCSCETNEVYDDGGHHRPLSSKLDFKPVFLSIVNDQGEDLLAPGPNCIDLTDIRVFHIENKVSIEVNEKMESILFEQFHHNYIVGFSISDSTVLYDLKGGIDTICRFTEEEKLEYNGNIVYEGKLSPYSMPVLIINYKLSHLKKDITTQQNWK